MRYDTNFEEVVAVMQLHIYRTLDRNFQREERVRRILGFLKK